jgi:transketolase
MLNPNLKLNTKIFDADCELKATRTGFGEGLVQAGRDNKNVVALSADLSESTRTEDFAIEFPNRFFEMGVAEQNMATTAAGLAVAGKIPFISSYAVFSPGRNWEQIRTTIAYNDANVKIAGHHAGLYTGPDGATHQMLEDVALMRVMPNMKVIVPCDAEEARKATLASAKIWGPIYLRFTREKTKLLTSRETPFEPGRAELFWESAKKKMDVLICTCGPMVYEAMLAAKNLEKEKISAAVLNVHTIKPLDEKTILHLGKIAGAVVVAEEHQVIGGLGGAVAELLTAKAPMPLERVGMRDEFGQSGKPMELMEIYGLKAEDIEQAVKKAIQRKK